jgi:hypothetical protein
MLDPAFVADCPYGPGGLLLDDITELDRDRSRIVARMPTHDELPITREQRAHPVRHPRHVSGGLMVHMTGMVGFAHFYYVLGLRHADGWIGYGGRIRSARFRAIAVPGQPLFIECIGTRERRSEQSIVSSYTFKITQEDTLVYDSEQTAMWMKVNID